MRNRESTLSSSRHAARRTHLLRWEYRIQLLLGFCRPLSRHQADAITGMPLRRNQSTMHTAICIRHLYVSVDSIRDGTQDGIDLLLLLHDVAHKTRLRVQCGRKSDHIKPRWHLLSLISASFAFFMLLNLFGFLCDVATVRNRTAQVGKRIAYQTAFVLALLKTRDVLSIDDAHMA